MKENRGQCSNGAYNVAQRLHRPAIVPRQLVGAILFRFDDHTGKKEHNNWGEVGEALADRIQLDLLRLSRCKPDSELL